MLPKIWDINFSVPGKPQALKRHRTVMRGSFTGTYDPSIEDKADFLALAMNNKPSIPYDEPLEVEFEFIFSRPKAHYRTGKNAGILKDNAPKWHIGTPDTDNLIKFVCDSLNSIFWKDDSRICGVEARKFYGDVPMVIIKVRRLEPPDTIF